MTAGPTLQLIVDTTRMAPGEKALDSLARKGEQTEQQITASMSDIERAMARSGVATGRLGAGMSQLDKALVQATGDLRPLNRELDQTGRAAEKAGGAFAGMAGKIRLMLGGLGAALGVHQLVNYADTWSDISARVGLAVGDMDNAAPTMSRLSDMARQTYSSLNLTAEGFIANSVSLRELGLNTQQQLDYTEALNNALVVSGARGQRAESVNRALAASMAMGKMQGDQLNTVLTSGGRVAQVLAAELGTTTNGLRQMATDGKITSDVIYNALVGSMGALRDEAASMPATMGDAFTLMGNSILTLVGSFDQVTGASATMATGIIKVSDGIKYLAANSNIVIGALSGITAALVASFIPAAYGAVTALAAQTGAFILLNGGIWGSVAALVAMRGALIATGIGAFAVAVGLVVAKFLDLADNVGGAGNAMSLLGDVGIEVAGRIGQGFVQAGALIASGATYMKGVFLEAFATIARGFASMMTTIAQGLKIIGVGDGVGIGSGFAAQLTADADAAMVTSLERATAAGTALRDLATTSLDSVAALRRATGGMFGPNLPDEIQATTDAVVEFGGGAKKAGKSASGAVKGVNELTQAADRWRQKLQGALGPMASYNRDMTELSSLHKAGALNAADYAKAQALVTGELADGLPMVGDVSKAFGDFIASGLRDAKGAFDSILGSFKNMISQMIAMAARNRIMLSMGFSRGAIGAAGSAMAGMPGAAGAPVGGLTGVGGVLGGIASLGTAAMSAFTGGLQAAMGGIGSITQYTSLMMGGATTSLAGLASAAGAIAVPLLAVAAVFSFFRKKTKELDAGLRITVDGLNTAVDTFRKTETRRFWGLSKKTRTSYDRADQETQDALSSIVGNIQTGVMDAAAALGFGAETFAGFAHQMTISTKGMSKEDAQRAVEQALAGLGDGFAGMIPGLNALRKDGESTTEALNRLSTSLTGVNGIMDTLGHRFHAVGLAGADAASKIAEAFGGLDAMVSATQQYYQAFYTDAERLAVTTRQTSAALAELGIAMPQTRQEYRRMIASLDLTTEAGREAYAALIGLSGAFDLILPQISGFTREMTALQDRVVASIGTVIGGLSEAIRLNTSAAADWRKAGDGIRDYLDKLRGTASALFSPQQARAYNQALYQRTLRQANSGDVEAAGRLPGVADSYLSSVNDMARSRTEAALAQARVAVALSKVAVRTDTTATALERVAALQQRQVDILTGVQNYLAAGNSLTQAGITRLLGQLGSLDDRIALRAGDARTIVAGVSDALGNANVTASLTGADGLRTSMGTLRMSLVDLRQAIAAETARSERQRKVAALNTYVGGLTANAAGNHFVDDADLTAMSRAAGINTAGLNTSQIRNRLASFDGGDLLRGTVYDPTGSLERNYLEKERLKQEVSGIYGTIRQMMTQYGVTTANPFVLNDKGVRSNPHTGHFFINGRHITDHNHPFWNTLWGSGGLWARFTSAETALRNTPGFATGGTHLGGLRIVGENGPELEATGPSRIFSHRQSRAMLDNSEMVRELRAVRAELAEMKAHARGTAESTRDTFKTLREINSVGVGIDPDRNVVSGLGFA
ncbi:tape measure protein [Paracoccus marcusii]|uniref:Tape measure protein n=1 Tax=Paracoccus marcusii TaxID=59779 RepID=A0ABY7UP14_9RHOB|nr:tape measure protein [Paracoccus marcusii]WDA11672.1 tape measure protein [Paracoccus marcusii]